MPGVNVFSRDRFHPNACPHNDENRRGGIICNNIDVTLTYRCTRCVLKCLKCIAPKISLIATSCEEARRAIGNPPICFCSES